jgi:MtfA peptidase
MFFGWLRSRRRAAIEQASFPSAWETILRRNVLHAAWLGEDARDRLRGFVNVFLAEKRFEGCGGLAVDDEVRVTIAALAGVAMAGFRGEYLDHLRSILVYPGDYRASRSTPLAGGGVLEWEEPRLGETWLGGSMVLSWPRVLEGGRFRGGGENLLVHEWAHALDAADGEVDGVPPLASPRARRRWAGEFAASMERFMVRLDDGRAVPLDPYAAEGPAEFFAVASECFFQDPHRLVRFDRSLHGLLVEAWRQDPAGWIPRRGTRLRAEVAEEIVEF